MSKILVEIPEAIVVHPLISDSEVLEKIKVDVSEKARIYGTSESSLQQDGDLKEHVVAKNEYTFPNGGLRAWLVVVGAGCTNIAAFGFINSWGVFQAYYEKTLLVNSSPSNIAWIGSLQLGLVWVPAVIVGRLFDLGQFRLPFLGGSIAVAVSPFIIAECTEFWHFILAQGIFVGISVGMTFGPLIGVIGNWFSTKRGIAWGWAVLGGSIGGVIFPITARHLIPKIGFPWTMRVLGFMIMGLLGIANVTLARRLPPKDIAGSLFNMKAFKSVAFTIYCLGIMTGFLGLYTVFTFIAVSAEDHGVPAKFATYLVSIGNAGSGVGRIVTGFIVVSTGSVNNIVPMTLAAGLVSYLWPLARTQSAFIAVSAIYGYMSAGLVSLFVLGLFDLGPIEDAGRRAGMGMLFAAAGSLAGPPISGAINRATDGYAAAGYYAGSMLVLSAILFLVTRQLVLKKIWGKF